MLTEIEQKVLDEVHEMAPLTANEIGHNLSMPRSTAQGVLARLKKQDLVVSDNYQQPITIWMLSDKGEQRYAQQNH